MREQKLKMIAQVQMLAISSPTITNFTTKSAWMKSVIGDMVAVPAVEIKSVTRHFPFGRQGA